MALRPIPVRAQVQLAGSRLLVDFDLPLQAGALNAANWTWDYGWSRFTGSDATAAGVRVTINSGLPAIGGPANVCHYTPPPADVISVCLAVALDFADFPIV